MRESPLAINYLQTGRYYPCNLYFKMQICLLMKVIMMPKRSRHLKSFTTMKLTILKMNTWLWIILFMVYRILQDSVVHVLNKGIWTEKSMVWVPALLELSWSQFIQLSFQNFRWFSLPLCKTSISLTLMMKVKRNNANETENYETLHRWYVCFT